MQTGLPAVPKSSNTAHYWPTPFNYAMCVPLFIITQRFCFSNSCRCAPVEVFAASQDSPLEWLYIPKVRRVKDHNAERRDLKKPKEKQRCKLAMHQNSHFLTLLLAFLFLSLIFSDEALLGGWTPIENIKDPHVTEIAEFAVAEYNKQSKASLKVLKVVKGETQVVAGTNYRLVLKATDGSATKTYQAVVWEKAWQNFRNLTSFNLVKG